ncbi:transposase [Mangrovicoccus sp. HB161399]|uniref:transposase n=1 Tax=Mangrovicoccus sp. HB161399 TaxID=2720392 RepID=UPI0015554797|nr:transposase [Mangrovicoccus sp. HB161399]
MDGFDLVLTEELPEPACFLADKGYGICKVREKPEDRCIVAVLPMRRNRKEWRAVDRDFCLWRKLAERCYSKLTQFRRVATRYDKTALSLLGFIDIDIASVRIRFRIMAT